jgi:hypothetical protein
MLRASLARWTGELHWRPEASQRKTKDPLLTIAPAIYVRELLGVAAAGERKVRCPFHSDERPSLHVYRAPERGWHCFSCRRGGSIYGFRTNP